MAKNYNTGGWGATAHDIEMARNVGPSFADVARWTNLLFNGTKEDIDNAFDNCQRRKNNLPPKTEWEKKLEKAFK